MLKTDRRKQLAHSTLDSPEPAHSPPSLHDRRVFEFGPSSDMINWGPTVTEGGSPTGGGRRHPWLLVSRLHRVPASHEAVLERLPAGMTSNSKDIPACCDKTEQFVHEDRYWRWTPPCFGSPKPSSSIDRRA